MAFWFVVGTAAELIKLYPLMEKAQALGRPWRVLLTGQSAANFWQQAQDFELPASQVVEVLGATRDLDRSSSALRWFLRAVTVSPDRLRGLAPIQKTDLVFVHGDTLSTLVGALWGRRLHARVVHVEAGMRSHNLWHPFPEEICRRLVSQLANVHMAPDREALLNLASEGVTENVFETGGNTVADCLRLAVADTEAPSGVYVLANIHRYENLSSASRWEKALEVVEAAARRHKVVMVLMPTTAEKLRQEPAARERLERAGVELRPRLPFRQFARLLHGAEYVISDGGSNQEECHYLGLPCLILRDVTERREGLGGACLLSRFDDQVIDAFLANPAAYRRPTAFPSISPTETLFQGLPA